MKLGLDIAEVFEPLLKPTRYKGGHAGRGRPCAGRIVIIMQDNDDAGAKKALTAAQALHGVALRQTVYCAGALAWVEDEGLLDHLLFGPGATR
jgi:hypothetical protein